MFLKFQQVGTTNALIKDATAFTIPAGAQGVMLQCDTNNIRYTMDVDTGPTPEQGMRLIAGDWPKQFTIEDFKRIRFIAEAADATLLVHFFGHADTPVAGTGAAAVEIDFLAGHPRPW